MEWKEPKQKKAWTYDEALNHLQKLCVIEDRCHFDLRRKLIEHKVYGDDLENILSDLITEGFLNEERYAKAFIRGKYRQKKWGRNKIRQALKQKHISEYCIKKGMKEIDLEEYYDILLEQTAKKLRTTRESNPYKLKQKVVNYLMTRGFEYELIAEAYQEVREREE